MVDMNNDAFMRNSNASVQARAKAQNRANVLQLKLIGQSHPTGLTPTLLKLFEPRPPLEYKPPPEKRKLPIKTGIAQYVSNFAEPGNPEYAPPAKKAETSAQRRARIHQQRLEEGAKIAATELEKYDPSNDPNISGDPYKTLFVARLNYETTENRLKREFESYGPIKKVRMIMDKVNNKPRGYAFIEYSDTRDMKAAYKQADGRKLDNKRVLVDVERGRTVPNWRPRRLGGGLGSSRVGGEDVNMKYSGREPQQLTSAPSRSEEPRAREERHVDRDREKSRERGRDRDREKSRERSHERTRDREPREERHHRDRDRTRDRDRDKDRGRDHDRTRDRDRGREHDRSKDRDRDRRERPRDRERDRGRSGEKDSDYDRVESKHGRDRHSERDRDHDNLELGYELPESEHDVYERSQDQGQYGRLEPHADQENYDRYDQMEPDDYRYDRAISESREREKIRDHEWDYRRSERSLSPEIDR